MTFNEQSNFRILSHASAAALPTLFRIKKSSFELYRDMRENGWFLRDKVDIPPLNAKTNCTFCQWFVVQQNDFFTRLARLDINKRGIANTHWIPSNG